MSLNYRLIAAGNLYIDTGMLSATDAGFFIHAPAVLAAQFPQFPGHGSLQERRASVDGAADALSST